MNTTSMEFAECCWIKACCKCKEFSKIDLNEASRRNISQLSQLSPSCLICCHYDNFYFKCDAFPEKFKGTDPSVSYVRYLIKSYFR